MIKQGDMYTVAFQFDQTLTKRKNLITFKPGQELEIVSPPNEYEFVEIRRPKKDKTYFIPLIKLKTHCVPNKTKEYQTLVDFQKWATNYLEGGLVNDNQNHKIAQMKMLAQSWLWEEDHKNDD